MVKIKLSVVLIAGGKGTRSIDPSIPKSLHVIAGSMLIRHQLRVLSKYNPISVTIVGHYGTEFLEPIVQELSIEFSSMDIKYLYEDIALGPLHALRLAIQDQEGNYQVVILGDILFELDILKFLQSTVALDSDFSLVVHPNDHPQDSDLVKINSLSSRVEAFYPKNQTSSQAFQGNTAIAGIFCIRTDWLNLTSLKTGDISHDLVPFGLRTGARMFAWVTADYCKDSGTPERIAGIQKDFYNKVIKNRSGTRKRACFLDLDNTLLPDLLVKNSVAIFEINAGIAIQLSRLNKLGIPVVVITNQPGIAKGQFTFEQFDDFRRNVDVALASKGAYIDAWYYCPHHPEGGWPGEIKSLKIECDCRKPKPGLLEKAAEDLGIDLESSWLIGDSSADKRAAEASNMSFLDANCLFDENSPHNTANALKKVGDQIDNN